MENLKPSNTICLLHLDAFKHLKEEFLEKLLEHHEERKYYKGELVFTPHDENGKIYLIESGRVELYQTSPEGRKIILEIAGPGGIFGNTTFTPLNGPGEVTDFAEAREDTVLCVVSKEDFDSILEQNPQIALHVIQLLGEKLHEADERIRDLALSNSKIKLINALIRMGKTYGKEEESKIIIDMHLTHEELGEIIGTARETVTHLMTELKEKGFIEVQDKKIIVNKNKISDTL